MIAERILAVVGMTVAGIAATAAAGAADPIRVIDDFETISPWSAFPAEGVTLGLSSDAGEHGRALRLDVKFTHGTGYAVARRAVSLDLPADYVFRFRMRGEIPNNALEFKLVDSTGNNVWWYVRRDLEFPHAWRTISTRKRQIQFAWGPAGGGEIRHVAAIEIAVTAGDGGGGSVWLDDFTLEPLAADSMMPKVTARGSSGQAAYAVDGSSQTAWRSASGDSMPWLELNLGRPGEFGGLDLKWAPGRHMSDYVVGLSLDGTTWSAADTVQGGDGGRDPLYLPESEARYLRIQALGPVRAPVELREATVRPLEWSATPEAYFTNLAKGAPRGTYPRPYVGEQCAWTVVGADAGREEALLSEDGMLETGKRQYSIEPFLRANGRFLTWADVRHTTGGEPSSPVAGWNGPSVRLEITAIAFPDTADPRVRVRYSVKNLDSVPRGVTLYLVVRPFQVNPPWQNIGAPGGTARIHRIRRDQQLVRVNDGSGFACFPVPSSFGAATLAQGELIDRLRRGHVPAQQEADDRDGFASAVAGYDLALRPGEVQVVQLIVPLRSLASSSVNQLPPVLPRSDMVSNQSRAASPFPVFRAAPSLDVAKTIDAQLSYILINRDGGAIQPGSRNYDRSWIRDGSLTSSALLRMGRPDVVRDFIEWYAPLQYENGKIPCCASERGPDPVTENDSHGEFIWLVAEYYRYTGDRVLVERMWPHVAAAVAHMDSLLGERRTAEWRAPEKRKFFGLLLPSISHEGYPNPMHSYWDDFFGYRGYVDAVFLADVLGRPEKTRFAASRDTFAHDLAASVAAAMAEKRIDYIPGCAEWGDFDATSTTVALTPTGAADLLPEAAVRATFERYWKFFTDRRDGKLKWDAFTPYEMRVIGSFVRLGWRDRANAALDWFMKYRTPPGWRQWAEVAYRNRRAPKYVGDMPHTWVGSDFVRSVLDMIAYDRDRDSSLVLAAGVPWRWIEADARHSDHGLVVRSVGTIYGPLSYRVEARAGDSVEATIEPGIRMPPGGIIVIPPARRPFRHATVNDDVAPITREGGVVVRELPARVVLSP